LNYLDYCFLRIFMMARAEPAMTKAANGIAGGTGDVGVGVGAVVMGRAVVRVVLVAGIVAGVVTTSVGVTVTVCSVYSLTLSLYPSA
jgi:hypothetical protein